MADDAAHPSIGLTYGMLELGMALALLLTGVASVQVWNYFRNYPNDRTYVKLLVCVVYVLDTLHTALLLHTSYYYTVLCFGNYPALQTMTWSLILSILLNAIIAFMVQTYYCMRVKRITESVAISLCCWVLAFARLVLNVIEVATLFRSGKWAVVQTFAIKWQMPSTQIVGAASDLLIAGFICAGLLRRRTGFRSTDKLVDKLVAFSIGSGLLTSLAAVTESILYLSFKNFAFVIPYSIVAKLFNNSLLAALNEREYNHREGANLSFRGTHSTRSDHLTSRKPDDIELNLHHDTQKQSNSTAYKVYNIGHTPADRLSTDE